MCRSKSPLDLVNKLNKQIPSNLACGVLFSPVFVNIEGSSLLSLEDKRKRKEQETEVQNPGKSGSHTLLPLCLYEYIVPLPIVFVRNLGNYPWCYFPNLGIISD